MEEKKPINHVLALKRALAKKHATEHPDADGKEVQPPKGKTPVFNNKPQKRVTGRGR